MKLFIRFFKKKKVFCKIDKRMKKKKQEKEFMQKWKKKKEREKPQESPYSVGMSLKSETQIVLSLAASHAVGCIQGP